MLKLFLMKIKEGTREDVFNENKGTSSVRVNINDLIFKYKKEKAKEKIETFIFVGLACVLVVISGIIVSL